MAGFASLGVVGGVVIANSSKHFISWDDTLESQKARGVLLSIFNYYSTDPLIGP